MILLQCYWKRRVTQETNGKGNKLFLGMAFASSGLTTGRTVPGEEVAIFSFFLSSEKILHMHILRDGPSILYLPI